MTWVMSYISVHLISLYTSYVRFSLCYIWHESCHISLCIVSTHLSLRTLRVCVCDNIHLQDGLPVHLMHASLCVIYDMSHVIYLCTCHVHIISVHRMYASLCAPYVCVCVTMSYWHDSFVTHIWHESCHISLCIQYTHLSLHLLCVCVWQHTSTEWSLCASYLRTHCNTLQHPATHCNTLQHTATHLLCASYLRTHCNTLQHTATHCNTPALCVLLTHATWLIHVSQTHLYMDESWMSHTSTGWSLCAYVRNSVCTSLCAHLSVHHSDMTHRCITDAFIPVKWLIRVYEWRHVTHTNKICHTHEWVVSHI